MNNKIRIWLIRSWQYSFFKLIFSRVGQKWELSARRKFPGIPGNFPESFVRFIFFCLNALPHHNESFKTKHVIFFLVILQEQQTYKSKSEFSSQHRYGRLICIFYYSNTEKNTFLSFVKWPVNKKNNKNNSGIP